jgi:hypothetical protein
MGERPHARSAERRRCTMKNRWIRIASKKRTDERTYCDVCGYDFVERTRNQIIISRGPV